MNQYELYKKIEELRIALKEYREGRIQKSSKDWTKEIATESEKMLKENYVVSSAGTPCSCCGGSGRS